LITVLTRDHSQWVHRARHRLQLRKSTVIPGCYRQGVAFAACSCRWAFVACQARAGRCRWMAGRNWRGLHGWWKSRKPTRCSTRQEPLALHVAGDRPLNAIGVHHDAL